MRTSNDTSEPPIKYPQRVMGYCHDSVGIGHLRRTLAICEHLGRACPETSFLLATGTPYFPVFKPAAPIDYIKLPALAKTTDGDYCSKFLGITFEQLRSCREALLRQATESFAPDLLLVDKAPLGVCSELVPTLRWLRCERPHVRIVFGMRDIEDAPAATIAQWTRSGASKVIEECYDEIWVYGMQRVFDVGEQYRLSPSIRAKLHYMGYIRHAPCQHASPTQRHGREILVTVGGGTDGERLIHAYLAGAAPRVAALGIRSTVIGGPDLPPQAATRLRAQASAIEGVEWLDFEGCMSCRIRRADLAVTMGGYNTLCEIATHRKPALVVPRNHPRLEQTIRAELWEKRGAVRFLPPETLSPESLAQRVQEMLLQEPRSTTPDLDLGGLDRIVERFQSLSREEARRAAAVRL